MNASDDSFQPIPDKDKKNSEELIVSLYHDLRKLAAAMLAREKPGQTLQPTALVHEAWLTLSAAERGKWRDEKQFFFAAAGTMERILVDVARRKATQKRGGGMVREEFDEAVLELQAPPDEIVLVHEALGRFESIDAENATVVRLHYFAGFTNEEIARLVGVPLRSVERMLAIAKAWLRTEIERTKRLDP